jgi:hypothetical protein
LNILMLIQLCDEGDEVHSTDQRLTSLCAGMRWQLVDTFRSARRASEQHMHQTWSAGLKPPLLLLYIGHERSLELVAQLQPAA